MDQLVKTKIQVELEEKMAGRMGDKKVTKQNLKVIYVDSENNLLMVKGSVPGKKNSIVYLKDSVKKSK